MGVIFSKFKKKKSNEEVLENLEEEIRSIEEYKTSTEERHKRIVGQLLAYSLGFYFLFGVFCYLYFPATLRQKIIYLMPLLLFPVILALLKKIISWYYVRKVNSNQSKLVKLRLQKKKILDDVMDKETYKVAKTILEKFAPENLQKKLQPMVTLPQRVAMPNTLIPGAEKVRKRMVGDTGTAADDLVIPKVGLQTLAAYKSSSTDAQKNRLLPLPAPIIPRDRSYLDKMVEYLIGDGPGNRYALICVHCRSHNGMVMREEIEYFSFQCCYCLTYNPASKQKPLAPKLPMKGKLCTLDSETEDSDTTSTSGSEGTEKKQESGPEAGTESGAEPGPEGGVDTQEASGNLSNNEVGLQEETDQTIPWKEKEEEEQTEEEEEEEEEADSNAETTDRDSTTENVQETEMQKLNATKEAD